MGSKYSFDLALVNKVWRVNDKLDCFIRYSSSIDVNALSFMGIYVCMFGSIGIDPGQKIALPLSITTVYYVCLSISVVPQYIHYKRYNMNQVKSRTMQFCPSPSVNNAILMSIK